MTEKAKKLGSECATGFHYGHGVENGLTKREYFAAMAMQGLCCEHYNSATDKSISSGLKQLSEYSVMCADSLLEELSKD